MHSLRAARTTALLLNFCSTITTRLPPPQCRHVSTISAINRSLRQSRREDGEVDGSQDDGRRRGQQRGHSRGDIRWKSAVESLGETVRAIQAAELAFPENTPVALINKAMSRLGQINRKGHYRTRLSAREQAEYMQNKLNSFGVYKMAGADVSLPVDRTVVVKRPGANQWDLVEKGRTIASVHGMEESENIEGKVKPVAGFKRAVKDAAVKQNERSTRPISLPPGGPVSDEILFRRLDSQFDILHRLLDSLRALEAQSGSDIPTTRELPGKRRRARLDDASSALEQQVSHLNDIAQSSSLAKEIALERARARLGGSLNLIRDRDQPTQSRGTVLKINDNIGGKPLFTIERGAPSARSITQEIESSNDAYQDIPLSIPYTTAASQFLYGLHTVLAALRSKRRKLYHLYLSARHDDTHAERAQITSLAASAGIPINWQVESALLDKMAGGRQHNGVVLETSKIPAPPTLALGRPDTKTHTIPISLDRQSAEEIAINGAPPAISSTAVNSWRQPFVVMLDGITDPANVGNIIRTAYFFGIDAVAISKTCATLDSAVLAKASSGACEAVRLLHLPKPANFVSESAKAGWHVYAAVAPPVPNGALAVNIPASQVGKRTTTASVQRNSPLVRHPCLLMLGAEGEGLRANLVSKADRLLSIEAEGRSKDVPDVGVDSLNVGVAAGLLMEAFLRKPINAITQGRAGGYIDNGLAF
ncbi:hypothetical protein M433DRAFT_155196 [Acidomyces richmondensis BFW]|nr:MAG: hypothetical protein FE78DRAFT_91850 [Acidomyces sp. 'richmondensis']KYG44810.1 hypothetical protein M433DRAFT_155196 [Acidomyces richmondensis BFW]